MTIRKTSKPCIGGATPKRDRADLATDGRSVRHPLNPCRSKVANARGFVRGSSRWSNGQKGKKTRFIRNPQT